MFKLESIVEMHYAGMPAAAVQKIGGILTIRLIGTLNELLSDNAG